MHSNCSESCSGMSNSLWPHGLYSPWGHKESDMTERLTQTDYGSLNNSYKTGVINLENEKSTADSSCRREGEMERRVGIYYP